MVIQWNGDFAERKFVGKLVADYGGTGKGFKSILSLPLFEDVKCRWKTIRLI